MEIAKFIKLECCRRADRLKLSIKEGLLPKLKSLLKCEPEEIKYEAINAVFNMTYQFEEFNQIIIENELHIALYEILKKMKNYNASISKGIILSLANIAVDSREMRDNIINLEILKEIQMIMKEGKEKITIDTYKNISYLLFSLCRYHPSPPESYVFFRSNVMIVIKMS